ncbi:MAG: hypothetical protein A2W63_04290 [Deltaproteobacteria bacterium RIFCSPLOWO2_02_44_9]|nr:MAG: hypothetical protein A2W63_04290 [Deltaproteobacteria bacterium RIFCSPLOWO2_02_44_9]
MLAPPCILAIFERELHLVQPTFPCPLIETFRGRLWLKSYICIKILNDNLLFYLVILLHPFIHPPQAEAPLIALERLYIENKAAF